MSGGGGGGGGGGNAVGLRGGLLCCDTHDVCHGIGEECANRMEFNKGDVGESNEWVSTAQ